ncbi:ABC transporter substrate-binding protein [Paenibacillus cremeus]|uniref:ABC transporter substrate-binding protein n=1 Tax=Paenibacillus cremeus TaxID=2163881 RepID=A0A559JHR3_9BACL|nr:ABC transporter substrate-binding protein [Paenibacillus cremeus]TVX99408.1 ABC transporter substrate-binding protein [Paenibacillus cremeus]
MKMNKRHSMKLSAFILLSLVLVTSGCATSGGGTAKPAAQGSSAPTKLPKVQIMVGGLEKIIYMPAKLTENLGYFKDEGLDVELTSQASGVNAEQALIAGEVQGVVGYYDHTIDIQSKGKYLETVVQFGVVPGQRLMVSNKMKDQIKTLADLKGKNIGVTSLGASTHFLASYLVTKGGNTPKDYVPLAVGSGSTVVAAFEQGKIDLVVTSQPTIALLESKGLATSLADMESSSGTKQTLGGTYPAASLYMNADYVKKNPEVVQHLANAFVKTEKYIASHTAEQIADLLPKEYYAGDKDMYLKALQASLSMFTPDGKMPAGGPEKVLEVLQTFNPQLKDTKTDLSKTFTNEFVDKVK